MAELINTTLERCEFSGCDKPPRGRLCSGHSEQRRLGRQLTTLKYKRPPGGTTPACTFASCDKLDAGRGLCEGHREQDRKGQALRPLGFRLPSGTASARDELGRKRCRDCLEWLSVEQFAGNRGQGGDLKNSCRSCRRITGLARKYSLSRERYEQMLAEQNHGCAICLVPFSEKVVPAVDHDHACCAQKHGSCGRCVRGLLCRGCNTALGNLGDDVGRLLRAVIYLVGRGEVERRLGGLEP